MNKLPLVVLPLTIFLYSSFSSAQENYLEQSAGDDLDEGAKLPVIEQHVTLELSEMNPYRVFVLDSAFPAGQAAKTYIIDGKSGKIEGMFNQAYWPNFGIAPDNSELYAVDTYFEKHTRGKRTDYLVVRDAKTLDVLSDIELINGRLLVVPKKYNFGTSADGKYGYTYNLVPVTSVGVTNLETREYIGDIEVPGCGLIFPVGNNQFTTICSDGSLATYTFDESLNTEVSRLENVFDSENDPAFEHSGWDRHNQLLHLITYSGKVISVDLSEPQAKVAKEWSLVTEEEKANRWLPGGWQLSHVNSENQELYVLMHQGNQWTHKNAGEEVWVFDVSSGEKVNTIKLEEHAISVAATQTSSETLVYTLSETAKLQIHHADSGELALLVENLGFSPQLITVSGE